MPIFVHDFGAYVPVSECEWCVSTRPYDDSLVRRIAEAFTHSSSRASEATEDMWTINVESHQQFIYFLKTFQYREADALLRNVFSTPLSHGFQQGEIVARALLTSTQSRDHVLTNYVDKLLALASFLRVIPIQNPEQGDFSSHLRRNPDSLMDEIEEKIGIAIRAPAFQGGLWGLKTRRGLFSDRDFLALFIALRIRDLVAGTTARICEIGAGAGYVAYYCRLLGYNDFTIIDLPTVGAVQAYFLARNLGPDKVFLAGEAASENGVKILSPDDFHRDSTRWDIVVNVDSLPEMASAVMEKYLKRIATASRLFLSINQEAHNQRTGAQGDFQERVGDVIDKLDLFSRAYRAPFWMRRGYAEELYTSLVQSSRSPRSFVT